MNRVSVTAWCPGCWAHHDPEALEHIGSRTYCPDCGSTVPDDCIPNGN